MKTSTSIQRKLMRMIALTSGAALMLTCASYFVYEFFTFRQAMISQLTILGEAISTNSTAALAFQNSDDAAETLTALKSDKHIVAACLYDKEGTLFAKYPSALPNSIFPRVPQEESFHFENTHLAGFQNVIQNGKRLGTLYLRSDIGAMYERFQLYAVIAILVIGFSFLLSYLLSKRLQQRISKPILALAKTARDISKNDDYSVRVVKLDDDEVGVLTEAINQMLTRIEEQTEEILSLNQGLEQKIIDRTSELQAANKELESFSYSVSHDLRAPLRSIHSYINILSEEYGEKLDNEARRLIAIVTSNSKKMGQLIDDLLAFSRLGRRELLRTPLNMNSLVSSVWEDQIRLQERSNVKLSSADLPNAVGDSAAITQVWTNLISNALKYSRHKECSMVDIGHFQKEDMTVYFVRDNGAGFDMKYYDKLFGVFQRLHSAKEFEGTGVGLAIVQRIVTRHGGTVWAESKVNEGTTFYFSLQNKSVSD
ncbi:MAG TPA: ATP-binding protein [Cyclobacteriaceae bacterium]|nr:ATP-binding protein [Cyclobacteriaceae bacterium]